jgi:ParB-like chromosome segregation protein Spo0J
MNTLEMNIFEIPVHPSADIFPMLDDDELEELASDIKDNGLQQPLVIDALNGNPRLIDGRNRREACRRAGVVPDYVLLDGQDPVAYILSANIHRRNMTKGQRAMVVARIRLVSNQTVREAANQSGLDHTRIVQANVVLHHAPDLADQVITGSLSLDNAYEEARVRKGRAETYESRFNALKAAAPDLAEMVVEEKLKLEEAQAAEQERAEQVRIRKKLLAEALHDLARHSYVLNPAYRGETVRFVLSEAELYKRHNAGPVDEFIEALEIFEQYAGLALNEIRGAKNGEES